MYFIISHISCLFVKCPLFYLIKNNNNVHCWRRNYFHLKVVICLRLFRGYLITIYNTLTITQEKCVCVYQNTRKYIFKIGKIHHRKKSILIYYIYSLFAYLDMNNLRTPLFCFPQWHILISKSVFFPSNHLFSSFLRNQSIIF